MNFKSFAECVVVLFAAACVFNGLALLSTLYLWILWSAVAYTLYTAIPKDPNTQHLVEYRLRISLMWPLALCYLMLYDPTLNGGNNASN